MKENWTRICPRCKSREVMERGMTSRVYSNDWVCLTCGWQSGTFPVIRKKYAEELPDQKKQFIRIQPLIIADDMKNSENGNKKNRSKRSAKIVLIIFLMVIFVVVMIIIFGRFLVL